MSEARMRTCMKYHSYIPASADEVQCPTCAQIAALAAERDRRVEDFEALRRGAAAAQQIANELLDEREKLKTELGRETARANYAKERWHATEGLVAVYSEERDRLHAALEAVEWGGRSHEEAPYCSQCGRLQEFGHASDCIVGQALGGKA